MRRDEESSTASSKSKEEEEDLRDIRDFVINTKVIAIPQPTRVRSCKDKKLIARDEKEEVQAKREYYQNTTSTTDALIMNICHNLVTRGLPSIFIVFSAIYMGFGMSYYHM